MRDRQSSVYPRDVVSSPKIQPKSNRFLCIYRTICAIMTHNKSPNTRFVARWRKRPNFDSIGLFLCPNFSCLHCNTKNTKLVHKTGFFEKHGISRYKGCGPLGPPGGSHLATPSEAPGCVWGHRLARRLAGSFQGEEKGVNR